jgi:hypothetical protein
MLRVGWIVAGWAPGVLRIPSRIRFHWITWSGEVAGAAVAGGAFVERVGRATRA